MKITKISYSMTRQIQPFHPASYTIEADITEGENPEEIAIALQLFTIKVLYKDSEKSRDELIKLLITDPSNKTKIESKDQPIASPAPIKVTKQEKITISTNTGEDNLHEPFEDLPF